MYIIVFSPGMAAMILPIHSIHSLGLCPHNTHMFSCLYLIAIEKAHTWLAFPGSGVFRLVSVSTIMITLLKSSFFFLDVLVIVVMSPSVL